MAILAPYRSGMFHHLSVSRALGSLTALFALCLCTTTARAQYRFDHWTADNGLPQNSVRDIVQTRDGYLWLTTYDGLVRFDGVRFTVFNKSNTPGLASNRFFRLFEDRFGDLWASVETGQLVRRHQGRFTIHTQQDWPVNVLPYLSDDGQGNVAFSYIQNKVEGNKVTEYIWRTYRYREGLFQPADELTYSSSKLEALGQTAGLGKEAASLLPSILIEGDLWATATNSVVRFLKGGGIQVSESWQCEFAESCGNHQVYDRRP